MDPNYFECIRQALLLHPERVAVVWPGAQGAGTTTSTGQAILDRVQALREALAATPLAPGQPVLLALPVGPDLICALLAVLAHGAVALLPPASASPTTVLRLVREARVRTVLTARRPGPGARFVAWGFGVRVVAVAALPGPVAASAPAAPVAAGQAALISHSSGSTGGQPKAIRRSHRVLRAQHEAIKEVFPPWAGQRDFPLFPNILLHNLAAEVVSILPDVPWGNLPQLDPARVVAQLRQKHVQTLTGNVFYFTALLGHLRRHPAPLPAVVGLGIGGSPVPERLVQELKTYFPSAAVHIIYGSSEAEPIAVRQVGAATCPAAGYCVGTLHPNLECQLRPLGQLLNGATVGEILVRGAHVATPEPGQWLPTGDYGYLAGGQLYLTGRQGNERLHHGVQHYQIEHVAQHVPGVERAAARADAAGFTLFVQGAQATGPALVQALAKHFPPGICGAVHFRSHLPVDRRHHSKILYDQLR